MFTNVYNRLMIINKTKIVSFRFQELDFEFLRKRAEKENIRLSELLRQIYKAWVKRQAKKEII